MIDAHCHIDLYPNPLSIAQECERLGIYTIAVTNLPSHFKKGVDYLKTFKKVRLALGMHPLYAIRHKSELEIFDECLDQTSYIGEIGLDFSKDGIQTKNEQLNSFKYVLQRITGKKKVVSLHTRGAERQTLQYLLDYNIHSAIFHWYSGPVDLIEEISQNGYMFSVNSAMIQSKKGQAIISQIPLENLITETDGPFIEFQGRQVRPSDLLIVENYLTNLWKTNHADLSKRIHTNFNNLISTIRH